MRAGDEAFEELRRVIDDLADAEAAELVAEARIEARAKVRSILAEAMAQALLERSRTELGAHVPVSREQRRPDDQRAATERGSVPVPVPVPAPVPADPADELGWYVYCVVGDPDFALPRPLNGVDARHEVRVLPEGDLAAVASQVPLSEFGEDALRESLNDVAWLEGTARAHERVLDDVRALTTVVPMRLCTIYRSEGSAAQMLARERAGFAEALARLKAKSEWGLKLFVDPSAAELAATETSGELARLDAEIRDASSGEAYMRRKQLDGLLRVEVDRLVDECAEDVHSRLARLAVEALRNPLQRPEVTGHSGQMVLNGVYLLDDAATDEFHAAVGALAEDHGSLGVDLQVTGPWPPYNFVTSSIEAAW